MRRAGPLAGDDWVPCGALLGGIDAMEDGGPLRGEDPRTELIVMDAGERVAEREREGKGNTLIDRLRAGHTALRARPGLPT